MGSSGSVSVLAAELETRHRSLEPARPTGSSLTWPRRTAEVVAPAATFHTSTASEPLRATRSPLSTSAGTGPGFSAAQRKPTKPNAAATPRPPAIASGPAPVPSTKEPPRVSAPGPPDNVLAPARHIRSSLPPSQLVHTVESGDQSATHSSRLPAMSKAPRAEMQAAAEPVRDTTFVALLQSVVPLSGPGSGVPSAPTCHSALDGSLLPELAHACCAWNHVTCADGICDGKLTA